MSAQKLLLNNQPLPSLESLPESAIDELTSLPNRREFTHALDLETRRAARSNQPMSLVILALDHFCAYNNIHGDTDGDACLQMVAETASRICKRASDFIARLDADQFGLILPAMDEAAAVIVAEKLVKTVAAMGIPNTAYAARDRGILTISAGVATNKSHWDLDGSALWVVADQAMLRAKHSGRNQVAITSG